MYHQCCLNLAVFTPSMIHVLSLVSRLRSKYTGHWLILYSLYICPSRDYTSSIIEVTCNVTGRCLPGFSNSCIASSSLSTFVSAACSPDCSSNFFVCSSSSSNFLKRSVQFISLSTRATQSTDASSSSGD